MKRIIWLAGVILTIGVLVVSGGCPSGRRAVEPTRVAPEPAEGIAIMHRLPMGRVDIILLIDQSSSMSGYREFPATDPEAWRVEAARYLVSNLAAKSVPGSVPRIGVVHFGTGAPSELSVPLTSLESEAEVRRLNARLKAMDLVWTNFVAAFREAERLFREARTLEEGRRGVIVLFTDGEPSDPRRLSSEAYFRELSEFMRAAFRVGTIDLFVLGIDAADMSWSKHREYWERLLPTPTSGVFHLQSPRELPRVYNDIVRVLYEIPDVAPDVVAEGRELQFDLPAYLEWVEFHIFPESRELVLSIVRPDGTVVKADEKGVAIQDYGSFSIVVVAAPEPGSWRYRLDQGRGRVEVYRNIVPVRLRLVSPRPQEILGTERQVVAEFTRQDGAPLQLHPDYPVQVEMTVCDPSGRQERRILSPAEPGIYTSDRPFAPQAAGAHEVRLAVHAAGAFLYSTEYGVEVRELPYLAPVRPRPGEKVRAGRELEVEVAVVVAGREIEPRRYFATPGTALVIAWFEPEGRQRTAAHYVHPVDGEGRLGGRLPYKVPRGTGRVRFRLVGTLLSGEPCPVDDLVVEFRGTVPGWVIAWPWVTALAFVAGVARALSYARRPRWSGRLVIEKVVGTHDHQDVELARFGKKPRITLGRRSDIALEDPEYPELGGYLVLVRRETELGVREVPCLYYRTRPGEPVSSQEFVEEGDAAMAGPFVIRYYWL